jgi:hypothetical protein
VSHCARFHAVQYPTCLRDQFTLTGLENYVVYFRTGRFLAILILFALSGCGGNNNESGPELGATEYYGVVTFDGPVKAAEVVISTQGGETIGKTKTDANGHYKIYIARAIKDYLVVANGGTF